MAEQKEEEKKKQKFTKEGYFKDYKRDEYEYLKDQILVSDYPKPVNRYTLVYEAHNQAVEPTYNFCLTTLRDLGFTVEKITDIFSASELSTLAGASGSKLGMSQDKAMSILRLLSELIRQVPVYIREIRWLEERLNFHTQSKKKNTAGGHAEITLKGIFVDLVEGGAKNAGSVIGLTTQVQFAPLADLFFQNRKNPGEDDDDFAKRIEQLKKDYNPSVVNLLARKLTQFYNWKKFNEEELSTRTDYLLKYLKQYYSNIKLYMNWVKPYLRKIKRLSMDLGKTATPDLIAAFEGSMVEIELLAKALPKGNEKYYNVVLLTLQYTTKPTMPFTSPDFQNRGPIHIGNVELNYRSYVWTDEDIANYKKMKSIEDMELLQDIDETLAEAMKGMPEDIEEWLKEKGAIAEEKEEEVEEEKRPSLIDPFVQIWKGFSDPVKEIKKNVKEGWGAVKKDLGGKEGKKGQTKEQEDTEEIAKKMCFLNYKLFKKAHGMVQW